MFTLKNFLLVITVSNILTYQGLLFSEELTNNLTEEWNVCGFVNPFDIPTEGEDFITYLSMAEVFMDTPQQWSESRQFPEDTWRLIHKCLLSVLGKNLADKQSEKWLKCYKYKLNDKIDITSYKIHYAINQYRIAVFFVLFENEIKEARIFILQKNKKIEEIIELLPEIPVGFVKFETSITVSEVPSGKKCNKLAKQSRNQQEEYQEYHGFFIRSKNSWRETLRENTN